MMIFYTDFFFFNEEKEELNQQAYPIDARAKSNQPSANEANRALLISDEIGRLQMVSPPANRLRRSYVTTVCCARRGMKEDSCFI